MRLRAAVATAGLFLSLGLLAVSGEAAQSPPSPKRLALLVGINDYKAPGISDLRGCVNDVERMRQLLTTKFGFEPANVVVLKDAGATRGVIIEAFRRELTAKAGLGDIVLFHYSGHGSRMPDANGDEVDRYDETIVPHDSRQGGVYDLSDDELNGLLRELSQKTRNVTVILDSCHSGTALRAAGLAIRQIPDDDRTPPPPADFAWSPRGITEGPDGIRPRDSSYVLIAGSGPQQFSNEFEAEGHRFGVLTYHLARALESAGPETTYRDIRDRVRAEVSALFPSQVPEMEGALADAVLFSGSASPAEPYVLVSPRAGGGVDVSAGAAHGLTLGSTLDVYPPATRTFGKDVRRSGRIELVRVEAFTSQGRVIDGRVTESLSRAALRDRAFADYKLRVYYEQPEASSVLRAVKAKLAEYSNVVPATDERSCDLILRQDQGEIVTEAADASPRSPRVPTSLANAADRVVEQVLQWVKWYAVLNLKNPNAPFQAGLGFTPEPGPDRLVPAGRQLDVKVQNLSTEGLFVTVLDLSTDGSISVVFPAPGASEQVPAKSWSQLRRIEFFVPEGRDSVQDTIKVFLTRKPLDPLVFTQGAVKGADRASRGPESSDPLAAFLENALQGRTRGARPVEVDGWVTAEAAFVVSRTAGGTEAPPSTAPIIGAPPTTGSTGLSVPPAGAMRGTLEGFLVHFPESTRGGLERARSALPVCPPDAGPSAEPCYELRPIGDEPTMMEAIPGGRRTAVRGEGGVGAVWDEAYSIRRAAGAERVEPSFEVDLSDWGVEDAPRTARGGRERPDKPAAAAETEWSLKQINVYAAWDAIHAGGHGDGEEGKSVVIGHPDTGYREHREYWDSDEAKSPSFYKHGYDFLGGDDNPFDELETSGLIPNPGHGTKSGSVIVSPKGKQWSGGQPNEYVSGVAPGAHLMPLRVHRSVVHFNPGRLTKAIVQAAGSDRTQVKLPAQVISISMGGVPSFGLWKAVRYAKSRGVIVVAAAGNEVGLVVWPARFGSTVAVAASNVECGIWEGSSHGGAVDITAPGESVWRASTDPMGVDSVGMGQGTTFATATTAGVAALWLDYHRDNPDVKRAKEEGRLTDVFRTILQATSWRPGETPPPGVTCAAVGPWKSKEYGAGIVDAGKALAAPIPSAAALRTLEAEAGRLPLFASLFEPPVAPEVADSTYRRLLRIDSTRAIGESEELEGEVALLYATDAEVRKAMDAAIQVRDAPDAAFAAARSAILSRDISKTLRSALGGA